MSTATATVEGQSYVPTLKWVAKHNNQTLQWDTETFASKKLEIHTSGTLVATSPLSFYMVGERAKTLNQLFFAFNLVALSVIGLKVTNYAILLVLLATALVFKNLSHLTTILIFERQESRGSEKQ